jgi:hypothetical protein
MPASLSSLQQTLLSFGTISRFLREGVAHEDSRQLRDSLGPLSLQIDEVIRLRRNGTDAHAITRRVVDLARCARQHQLFLTELGAAWHALYEFDAYQRVLRELRDAIAAWQQALEHHSPREQACFRLFELLAWRTLGEALLLIDIYEQPADTHSDVPYALPQRLSGWQRVRAWFGACGNKIVNMF